MHLDVFAAGDWAAQVADRFEAFLADHPRARMSLPTGSTPKPFYAELVARHTDLSEVQLFLLDEFGGIADDHPARCEGMLRRDLIGRLDRPPRVHLFDIDADDVASAAAGHEAKIAAMGGLDLAVLGLGSNGHVALNEPGSGPDSRTRVVQLAPETIASASRYGDADQQPTWGVTLGMETILAAGEAWLLVTGEAKAEILDRVIHGPVSADVPASLLALSPRATIYADEEAARR